LLGAGRIGLRLKHRWSARRREERGRGISDDGARERWQGYNQKKLFHQKREGEREGALNPRRLLPPGKTILGRKAGRPGPPYHPPTKCLSTRAFL